MKGLNNGIPVSVSLNPLLEKEGFLPKKPQNKKRLFTIAALAVLIAVCMSFVAKLLVGLIDLITNISFYGQFSTEPVSPSQNSLGLFVIIVPVIGALVIGLMAFYGSKAIRGHGIPEAMEQILTNQSKIKPSITFLKPVSAAISIGTGGPFGAEGPIIATGGALGSTFGQLLKISHNERKILLSAGATAGMSAIFGSPIAAVFLAIELLLFEFSPRSLIPVALACITGAAGHHLLFGEGVVFPVSEGIKPASNSALGFYCLMGIVVGLFSVLVTKIVYWVEDGFEKLPVHWALWPAIGAVVVGVVGYFAPRTLGVGYYNIIDILSGNVPIHLLLVLCFLKFISWSVSLGSGTSGGTLAPLLTIGGASGALLGSVIIYFFPGSGITISLAALVGMAAMFAGASRAYLTSVVFALETTGQFNALLPLLAGCTTAYFVSYFIMENTIMTEKIARRGVKTPHSYEPDVLEKIKVEQILKDNAIIINEKISVGEIRKMSANADKSRSNFFIVSGSDGDYKGILNSAEILSYDVAEEKSAGELVKNNMIYIGQKDTLLTAIEIMTKENITVIPVVAKENADIIGVLSFSDIISAYKNNLDEHERNPPFISLKRYSLKQLLDRKKSVLPKK